MTLADKKKNIFNVSISSQKQEKNVANALTLALS